MAAWLLLVCTWLFGGVALAQDDSGVLKITSNVDGAVVHVDYEQVGETPLTRYVPPGRYTVRVTADGYDPFVRQVKVTRDGVTPVDAKLRQGGSTIDVVTTPGGASVVVNGQDTNLTTPTRLTGLQNGTYRVELTKPGHEPYETSVTIKAGNNPLIQAELASSRGRFVITSKPEGADVYLDGASVGQTPLELEDIDPGVHQVGLVKAGYAVVVRTVDTTDGSKGEVTAKLKQDGTRIIVKTGNAGATVMLDGVPVGTGKRVEVVAARGSYLCEVSAPGTTGVSEDVKVPVGGAVLYTADLTEGTLAVGKPMARRPIFWTGVGVGVAALATGTSVAVAATRPDPPPSGDYVLTLP